MKKGASKGLFVLASVTLIVAGVGMSHAGKGNAMSYAAQPRNKSTRPISREENRLPSQRHHTSWKGPIKVYYLDFTLSTYSAVTSANIVQEVRGITVSNSHDVSALWQYVGEQRSACAFEGNLVRLRIDNDKGETLALVDQEGTVKMEGSQAELRPIAFVRLYSLLNRLSGAKK